MDKLTDYELELLIQQVEGHEMLRAPVRLKGEIIEKSQQMQKQMQMQKQKQIQKQKQMQIQKQIQSTHEKIYSQKRITRAGVRTELIVYSFKTAAAVAVAVFLFGFVNQPTLQEELRLKRYNGWENITLSKDGNRYHDNDAYWDGEDIPRRNWQISDILQEINKKWMDF